MIDERAPSRGTPRFAKSELARAAIGVLGVGLAGWFFFTTENMLHADLWLVAFLAAGEFGGRIAARWIERREQIATVEPDRRKGRR